MKEKLLIVSWYGMNNVGGVERVTQYMYEAWKEKYDVRIIDLTYIKKKFKIANLFIGVHYVMDSFIMSWCVNKICKKCKKQNIGYKCVTQGYNAPFVKADAAFAHGTMRGFKIALEGNKARWRFNQLFEKICYKNSTQVITVASHVADEVSQLYGISLTKIHILENCVDTKFFTPDYGMVRKDMYRIIFVGRLEQRKGVDKLLALARMIEKDNRFELHIATQALLNIDIFKKFSRTIVKQGLNKNDMKKFYQSGDLMFFPSLYEGFEMVTTECLSCGVPVIGNKVGAIHDLYERGLDGVYILSENNQMSLEFLAQICEKYRDCKNKSLLHDNMEQFYSEEVYKKRLWELL